MAFDQVFATALRPTLYTHVQDTLTDGFTGASEAGETDGVAFEYGYLEGFGEGRMDNAGRGAIVELGENVGFEVAGGTNDGGGEKA